MSLSDSYEALSLLGFTPFFQRQHLALEVDVLPERVIAEQRGEYLLLGIGGQRRAVLSGRLRHTADADGFPAVGDWILCDAEQGEPARITHVFERATCFARKRVFVSSQAQIIAANVDLAVVVAAFSPDSADDAASEHGINRRRLERYLWAIAESGARALIALNKADLCAEPEVAAQALGLALGNVDVVAVSAERGTGIDALLGRLGRGETAALVGSSGVGKSSLVNRLLGAQMQRVNDIREDDARGRHTTTARQLFALPGGGFVVDTPGMRELGLLSGDGPEAEGGAPFDEIEQLGQGCRFRDCRHEQEPGCAVRAAVESGALDEERLDHSHQLRREAERQRERQDARLQQETRRKHKALARQVRASLIRKGRGD
ncbi:MAG TPA: ribosome small subunit-dependent GTPase A [Polyangiaceae bacterium]|nr:ribosome small subunit-dependent GTPase A [Polyangiaceae bacterium]